MGATRLQNGQFPNHIVSPSAASIFDASIPACVQAPPTFSLTDAFPQRTHLQSTYQLSRGSWVLLTLGDIADMLYIYASLAQAKHT